MAAEEPPPAWLPEGWTMEVRTRTNGATAGVKDRYYTTPAIGRLFRSKNEILRYFESRGLGNGITESVKTSAAADDKRPLVKKFENVPEWLPKGWTAEVRTRKGGLKPGARYKCYIDPLTGHKFYSKNQVFEHLEMGQTSSKIGKRKRRSIHDLSLDNMYTDPASGCIFSSKKDVFDDGQPGTSEWHGSTLLNSVDNTFSPPFATAERQKLLASTARRSLFNTEQSMVHSTGAYSLHPLNQCGEHNGLLCITPPNSLLLKETPYMKQLPQLKEEKLLVHQNVISNEVVAVPVSLGDGKQLDNFIPLESGSGEKADKSMIVVVDNTVKEKGVPLTAVNKNTAYSPSLKFEGSKPLESKIPPELEKKKLGGEQHLAESAENKPSENREENCRAETINVHRKEVKAQKGIITLPRRTSKRLAGLPAEVDPEFADPEQARRLAKWRSIQLSSPSHKDFNPSIAAASAHACMELDQLDNSPQAKSEIEYPEGKKSLWHVNSAEKYEQGADKPINQKLSSPPAFLFGDSWVDPCLEFAFKMLTDANPVDCWLGSELFPTGTSQSASRMP